MACLEYGQEYLHEELWVPMLMIRSNVVNQVEGGIVSSDSQACATSISWRAQLGDWSPPFPGAEACRAFH